MQYYILQYKKMICDESKLGNFLGIEYNRKSTRNKVRKIIVIFSIAVYLYWYLYDDKT